MSTSIKPIYLVFIFLGICAIIFGLWWQGRELSTTDTMILQNEDKYTQINENEKKLTPIDVIGYSYFDCLAIKNNSLKKGDKVQLVLLKEPQEIIEVSVDSPISEEGSCKGDIYYQDYAYSPSYYRLDISNAGNIENAIAIADAEVQSRRNGNFITADVNSDNIYEFFSTCYGTEGTNFYVWSGEPWKSKILWHFYSYLGFDIESSCPDITSQQAEELGI